MVTFIRRTVSGQFKLFHCTAPLEKQVACLILVPESSWKTKQKSWYWFSNKETLQINRIIAMIKPVQYSLSTLSSFFSSSWSPEWDWADIWTGTDVTAGDPGCRHHQPPVTAGKDFPRPHYRLCQDHLSKGEQKSYLFSDERSQPVWDIRESEKQMQMSWMQKIRTVTNGKNWGDVSSTLADALINSTGVFGLLLSSVKAGISFL